nr:MAG TPA: hypothetical protein [Crassvirales sp.]DAG98994.1 MAG TPA: hypothetical protein [Crassvirales sp.]
MLNYFIIINKLIQHIEKNLIFAIINHIINF